jgi:hypothetical protein
VLDIVQNDAVVSVTMYLRRQPAQYLVFSAFSLKITARRRVLKMYALKLVNKGSGYPQSCVAARHTLLLVNPSVFLNSKNSIRIFKKHGHKYVPSLLQ